MITNIPIFGTLTRDAELKASTDGKPYLHIIFGFGLGSPSSAKAAKTWRAGFLEIFGIDIGESNGAEDSLSATVLDPDAIATADKFVKGAKVLIFGSMAGNDRDGFIVTASFCRLRQDVTDQDRRDIGDMIESSGRLQ